MNRDTSYLIASHWLKINATMSSDTSWIGHTWFYWILVEFLFSIHILGLTLSHWLKSVYCHKPKSNYVSPQIGVIQLQMAWNVLVNTFWRITSGLSFSPLIHPIHFASLHLTNPYPRSKTDAYLFSTHFFLHCLQNLKQQSICTDAGKNCESLFSFFFFAQRQLIPNLKKAKSLYNRNTSYT